MKFQRRHLEDFAWRVEPAWNLRGTRDTKIQVIECQFLLCISLLCACTVENRGLKGLQLAEKHKRNFDLSKEGPGSIQPGFLVRGQ